MNRAWYVQGYAMIIASFVLAYWAPRSISLLAVGLAVGMNFSILKTLKKEGWWR